MRLTVRLLATVTAAAVLALPLGGAAASPPRPAPQPAPRRIMSMNLCSDLMLVQFVPKSRIVSFSYLAHDGLGVMFPGADKGVHVNHGTAEDIINLKPDLILTDDFSAAATRKLAAKAGAKLVEVKSTTSFADVRTALRQVGAAVGDPARAEELIAQMDGKLAWLSAHPSRKTWRVVAWSGGDSVPGKMTLTNEIIEAAGAVNIAALPGNTFRTFDVERLLIADPDALLYGRSPIDSDPALRSEEGRHRLVRRVYGDRRIAYNDLAHTCGLPQSADSAIAIRRALDGLPDRRPLK